MKASSFVGLLLTACVTAHAPAPSTAKAVAPPTAPVAAEPICPAAMPTVAEGAVPTGARIEKVCLLGASEDDYLRLHEAVAPREGTSLDPLVLRDDLEVLYAQGSVSDVVVATQALPSGGVMLLYGVAPFDVVGSLTVTGAPALGDDTIAPKSLRADPRVLKALVRQVTDALLERGYAQATVRSTLTPVSPGKVAVVLEANQGQRQVVSSITFDGRKVLLERELTAALHSRIGEPWRQDLVERDELALTEVAFDHGLINARVRAVAPEPAVDGKVTLRFTLEEGSVFTIGKLTVTGVPAADQKPLLDSLETRPKQTFVRSQITRDLKRLEHSGRQHGVTLEVTPVTQVDTAKKKVDITFELTPKSEGAIHF